MNEETLVPLDESDLIAYYGRQDQKIRELEAALAEKEADWQLKQEQIAVLETVVKEKDKVIRESCVIIAEGIKVVEGLEKQITDLTDELGTVKEVLRQLNNRDKRLQDEALRGGEVK